MKGAAKCVLQMDARPLPIKLQQVFEEFPEAAFRVPELAEGMAESG